MKKLILCLMTTMLSLFFIPNQLQAETTVISSIKAADNAIDKASEKAEANVLLGRLEVINAMDKSKLSAAEKQVMRSEVRSIKTQLKELGGGVYLSVGAIIIILLILILIT